MEIILTSILTFASTNIDDIFILMLFYGDKKFTSREIVVGQLLGISALVIISLIFSLAGLFIDKSYIGLLGLFPIYLGIKGIWYLIKKNEDDDESVIIGKSGKSNLIAISGVTIANGGDNIGIYVPLFSTIPWFDKSLMIFIFLIMTVLWCVVARYLANHPYLAKGINKYSHIVTPFVLILLGVFILHESGTLNLVKLINWG